MRGVLRHSSGILFWALLTAAFAAACLPRAFASPSAAKEASRSEALKTVKAYLQAIHARDAAGAYRHISSVDRDLRDERTYLRSQENFTGFALDLARRAAADMEVWIIGESLGPARARLDVGYRIPTGDEITSRLHAWNPEKLNALSPASRSEVILAWEKLRQDSGKVTLEGREAFDLVREKDGWRIFLDWRSRHRVVFKAARSPAGLAVEFLRNDFLVKKEEPFQIDFKVINRGERDLVVRLDHLFEPRRLEANVDMIACGSLLPLRLRPRATREISSSYLVRGDLPAGTRLDIVYDFHPLPGTAVKSKTATPR